MKRLIDYYLNNWKNDRYRKPLLLRGARQIGKTHAARELGKSFTEFIEINLEETPEAQLIFQKNLKPHRIMHELSVLLKKSINPGTSLLFLDEIQAIPQAILALRYFYEQIPQLHIIAAGSLLDFAIEKIGMPVGRVQSLYMYPMSFIEFLAALDEKQVINEILNHNLNEKMSEVIHRKILNLVGEYLALGGMPQAVKCWQETRNAIDCSKIHTALIDTYRHDFGKYAKKLQTKYVELLFDHIPLQLGKKFKYSLIEGEYRKRELAPALDLLVTAGVGHKIFYSPGQGIPLGALMDPHDYKVIFLDVGLSQATLNFDLAGWFINPLAQFVNKGVLVEAFVGQEILTYSDPNRKHYLYYWRQKAASKQAEIDYLLQEAHHIIPVEVKSGDGRTIKSLRTFLETHASPYGIRFSAQNYSIFEKIHSYPLYAVASVMSSKREEVKKALRTLAL